jgi:diguanylate cyclase (GGDEF)-like protein
VRGFLHPFGCLGFPAFELGSESPFRVPPRPAKRPTCGLIKRLLQHLASPASRGLDRPADPGVPLRHLDAGTFLALHDTLTGLPNEALFDDRLAHTLSQANRYGDGAAVIVVELERFSESVVSSSGTILREAAERLTATLRECDTVARIGPRRFGIVLARLTGTGARVSATRMHAALARPFRVDGALVEIPASLGVAVHPDHATTTQLVQLAKVAMDRARRTGTGYAMFDEVERRTPASDLRVA